MDAFGKWVKNIDIYNNEVHDVGGGGITLAREHNGATSELANINVYNNVTYRIYREGVMLYNHSLDQGGGILDNIKIINNTIYDCSRNGIRAIHPYVSLNTVYIRNNIIWKTASGALNTNPEVVKSNNNAEDHDPKFVSESTGDFHLLSSSLDIDAGTFTDAPSFDFDYVARPQGSAIDIGAYEYISGGGPTIPNAPSNLAASAVSSSQIDLSWTDNSSDEDGFKIERKTGGGSYSEIAQVGADVTNYSDTGLSASTTYTYRVCAYNSAGNSAYSNEASATTQSGGGPVTLFSDDFEDGNDNGWTVESGTWSVVSDAGSMRYQQGTYSTSEYRTAAGDNSWTDYTVEVKVKPLSFDGNSNVEVKFRYNGNANTYRVILNGWNSLKLNKNVGGTQTTLASKSYTFSAGTIYTIKAEANGTSLKVYVNGVEELSVTDNSFSSGRIALSTWKTTANFDDVLVQDLSGGLGKKPSNGDIPISNEPVIPDEFSIKGYPNPFNPTVNIQYSLPKAGHVEITVYDITGRKVAELYNGSQTTGVYTRQWDAVSQNGTKLGAGIYFCHIRFGSFSRTLKLMFMP